MTNIRGLVVMDVDSTLVKEEVIDLLGNEAGFGREIAYITEKAMNGQIDFQEALEERVALLKGLPMTILDTVYNKIHPQAGAKELIDWLHAHHYKVGLVSGGFHETVDRLANKLSIDYVKANHLDISDDLLTGKLNGEIVTKEVKLRQLKEWAEENGLTMEQTVAMGDGANDIPMIQAAGIGVAFCAKEIVKKQSPFQIIKQDLRELITIIEKEKSNESH